MGVTTTALLTVEQFADLPQEENQSNELVHGEIVRMSNAKLLHEMVKANGAEILTRYVIENPIFKVFSETMYKLDSGDGYVPDVSLLLKQRLHLADRLKTIE